MPTKLRIAIVTRRFGARFGGAEAYAENLTRVLIQTHDVRVICQEFDSPVQAPFTRVPCNSLLPRWLNQLWFNLCCHLLVRQGYDIVHSHENSWVGNVQVVHVMPVRYSLFMHNRSLVKRIGALLSPRLISYLLLERLRFRVQPNRVLVAPAHQTIDQLQAAYKRLPPMVTIHPGVTLPDDVQTRNDALESLGLDPSAIYCLLVANDPLRKGFMTILSALESLDAQYHLIVLGGPADGQDKLREVIPPALAHRVHAFAARPDVCRFYSCSDVYVHPTLQDSFGMAPLEAMSFGLPVILSSKEYCGFTACVEAEHDALVVADPRDACELAAAIQRITQDAVLRGKLRTNGLALAARFDWRQVEQAFVKTYAKVLDKSPA
ncbi:glycosyltransferase family 4 protein [Pigmentiphaga litoralis]|uniref:UDP-glucose:(Heptosyl)LPS alpha-1,3-glucosyltransferase n=1 Tax=Pigmentiphaga litoralis TaxID=516702 RepID=A0A7Y9IZK0_9BURK|nr:UDP-glucose:(heptosyl)LPS alpha-1,3-glucosyltransferase [Pigmentiphaga litoralis]NYE86051.1 UDP-glucose:(heptosyl)LPS alpha-1,3-glucosyltransferase [Pigmentiphaga litoralis]